MKFVFINSKIFVLIEITIIVAASLIISYNAHLYNYRHLILIISLFYALIMCKLSGYSRKELGVRFDNLKKSGMVFGVITALILALELMLIFLTNDKLLLRNVDSKNDFFGFMPWYISYMLISSPATEFLFRGYLLNRIKLINNNPIFINLLISILFFLAHLPTGNLYIILGSFIVSIFWTWYYIKSPNLFAVTLSHSIIGGMVIPITKILNYFL